MGFAGFVFFTEKGREDKSKRKLGKKKKNPPQNKQNPSNPTAMHFITSRII